MNPFIYDEEYSAILLGTARSPGVVTLSGHDRQKNWDVKAAKGQTGASSSLGGDPVGTFKASFYLASDNLDEGEEDDFDRWDKFQFLLEAMNAGTAPAAVPIYHPDLARNNFTEVAVKSIGGMVHDGKGGATVVVEFIEYKPPKPKPASKAKAKPGTSTAAATKPDPNARAKAELAGLLAEARRP